MAVTKEDVEYIAKLARLELKDTEIDNYTNQLNQILEYMDKLNEVDTSNVEPLLHPVENQNVFREDKIKNTSSKEDTMKNAPQSDGNFFKVPKIIKTD
jgi:aspartyl-tRNA(Asn)/glutamyl-tRNA(Gln) amidotransferase subunit C